MTGIDNLIPQNKRTKEEQRAIAVMGGQASGRVRRKQKALKEILRHYMEMPNIEHPDMTNAEVMELHLANAAVVKRNGVVNLKAIDMVHSMLGEKPQDKDTGNFAEQVIRYVSDAEYKEVNKHIDSVIGDTDDRPKYDSQDE